MYVDVGFISIDIFIWMIYDPGWLVKHLCEMGCLLPGNLMAFTAPLSASLSFSHTPHHSHSQSVFLSLSIAILNYLWLCLLYSQSNCTTEKIHRLQLNGHSMCCVHFFLAVFLLFFWFSEWMWLRLGVSHRLAGYLSKYAEHWKESSNLGPAPCCEWVIKKYCGCILSHNEGL